MGLLDCASANSIWRGYDYYKRTRFPTSISLPP